MRGIIVKTKINEEIRAVLEEFGSRYLIDGRVNKNKVIEDLHAYDQDLLNRLIENSTIAKHFTIQVGERMVFKVHQLIELFEADEYWQDSFTKYSKKIGLTSNGKFIDEFSDVVLDFPYKDTILKASMSKEDTDKDDLKPDEPFLNEIIAKEEIDVLLDKKILVNAKKYTSAGVTEIDRFQEDDNLIIKGNNLLALHTLKEKYAEKIKLIYIDPPYNTEGDSFKYNDNFNRSTWLTFMKNRLDIARILLNDEGVIAVQCSFHEYAYLKVLMDNIFGESKHIVTFNVLVRHPQRSMTADKKFNDVVEYVLIYSKNSHYDFPKIRKEKTADDYIYSIRLLDESKETLIMDSKEVEVYSPEQYEIVENEPSSSQLKSISIRGSLREKNSSGRFYVKHLEKLKETYEPMTLFKVPNMGDDGLGYRFFHLPKKGNKNGTYFQGMPQSSSYTEIPYPNFLDFVEQYNRVNEQGGVELRNGKKPEQLLSFIIQLLSKENDIVLDFFMGSATTQAAALKLNRRFIGVEQMDYIETISVPRLQNVIKGEQGGISKEVQWQGGGSFVYVELMEKNRGFLKSIRKAKNHNELREIFEFMLEEAEIDFRVDLEKVKETLHELSLDDQKRLLIKIIDKNQLYYNYSEIDDERVRDLVTDNDYAFNKSFYDESGE